MTNTPGPTWYDVLGVSRDADSDEIRAAWRAATDKFEPGSGSGQFRMFNEAAEVLLDPARRAAYDASLGGSVQAEAAAEDVQPEPAPASAPPAVATEPKQEKVRRTRPPDEPASRRAVVAAAVLAVLTLVALGLVVVFGLQVRSDAKVSDA